MSYTSSNYDFKNKPPDDYFCPTSSELLVSANQTSCCGRHISEETAVALEQEEKPCPLCGKPGLHSTRDLYFRRQVEQVVVYCPKKPQGCKWEGELSSLEAHVGYGSFEAGDCKHVEVPCPYLCRTLIARLKIKQHMKENCPKRPYMCNYCNFESNHSSIVNDHLPVCDKFPTRCPNNCDEMLCRADVKRHMETTCPLQVVACEFDFAGCRTANMYRKDLKKHMEHGMHTHVDMLARYCRARDKEIRGLKSQVQLLTNIVAQHLKRPSDIITGNTSDIGFVQPPVMTLRNFQELHMKKEYWKSPGFFSHIGGYKMCLVVFPGSETDQHGNEFMGVYLQMLQGEFDDQLKWPFRGKVEVRMLNQAVGDKGHVDRVLLDASSYSMENFQTKMVDRVLSAKDTPSVWGCGNFMALKNLRFNKSTHTQFLKDDCIDFQVLSVTLLE